jgi:hypothetical protein
LKLHLHEIIFRGGFHSGKIVKVEIGNKAVALPLPPSAASSGYGRVVYHPTDERENGRQVYRPEREH